MPSFDLFRQFDQHMQVETDWWINGMHYARTCEAWLDKLDGNREATVSGLAAGNNPASLDVQLQRWRMFFTFSAQS